MASAIPNEDFETDDDIKNDESINFLPLQSDITTEAMASEDSPKHSKYRPESIFWQHLTTAAHACILLYLLLIIYFCFFGEFVFFTWHPLLMSIGWLFLMTEAILALSKDNILTGTLPKLIRLRLHWIFQTIALTLTLIGFIIAYINKDNLGKQHFKTWHALFGLIAIICGIPTSLDGVLALYHGRLRHYLRPKLVKFVHVASGVAMFGFGGLALILSVYSNWFAKQSGHNGITFVLGLALVLGAVVWTLIRPLVTCCNQLKHLL